MNTHMSKKIMIILIITVVTGLIAFFVYDEIKTRSERQIGVELATRNYEVAQENITKASLDIYYVSKGEYPRNSGQLVEELKTIEGVEIDTLEKSINNLKDFNYQIRGDEQAYQFSYSDSSNVKHSVEGEYKKNFKN